MSLTKRHKVRMLLTSLFISRRGKFNPFLPVVYCFRPGGKILSEKLWLKLRSLLTRTNVAALQKASLYKNWLDQYSSQKKSTSGNPDVLTYKPVISILVPTYNTPVTFLHEMVESVRNQWYPHWELCIADDCSTLAETREYLQHLAGKNESNIRITFRETNGHICESSNSALNMASGEFCALLDHDDLLTNDALWEVVKQLNEQRDCEFLYSDEDKTDGNGIFSEPNFKPLWSPDNLLSRNYTGHLVVFKTTLATSVGGFEKGLEGSQDYDLYLKLTERAVLISHIPKLLYRWRKHEASVAMNAGSKPYAYVAAELALSNALKRRGEEGKVIPLENDMLGFYTVRYKLQEYKKISIVVVCAGNIDAVKRCVASILHACTYPDFEILVVDSDRENFLTDTDRLRFVHCEENLLAQQLNAGIEHALGEYIVVLDSNVHMISSDWLESMAAQVQRNSVGVVGAKLVYPDQTVYSAGMTFDSTGLPYSIFENYPVFLHHKLINTINNYPMVSGACMMFRKEIFNKLKKLDASVGPRCSEDFCLKSIQSGYFNVYLPHVEMQYFEHDSNDVSSNHETIVFVSRWKMLIDIYNQHSLGYNSDFMY